MKDVTTHGDDARDPWFAEAEAFTDGHGQRDYDVANAAQLPEDLEDFSFEAAEDASFSATLNEWFDYFNEGDDHVLMLAMEQSCSEGRPPNRSTACMCSRTASRFALSLAVSRARRRIT